MTSHSDFNTADQIPRVGLVIPTLNAGDQWVDNLARIEQQSLALHRMLIVDSASTDNTAPTAEKAGFQVIRIERAQFNHGGTRQQALEFLSDCDLIVFLTQDAQLADRAALAELVACFSDPAVAVAYGRQLPRPGASPIEAHARAFNYGERSEKKSAANAASFGTKVFFCSNSFAAYRRSVIMELGGFSRDLILGEDMEMAARAIKAGFTNCYCASARAYHSHDYNIGQTFSRYFDLGVFEQKNQWMRREFGSHKSEGARFIQSEFRYLKNRAPLEIPRALVQTCAKLAGYRLGKLCDLMPAGLNRGLSMQPSYWK